MMIQFETVERFDIGFEVRRYRVTDQDGYFGHVLYVEGSGYRVYDASDALTGVFETKAEVGRYFREIAEELS